MRTTITTLLMICTLLFANAHAGEHQKPGHLLTVLTAESDHTLAMGLILTRHYLAEGGTAQVLLCDAAAELALKESNTGSAVVQPAGVSARQMLGGLIEAGVKVEVCAIFLPNREETADDLRKGVGVAGPAAIAAVMAAPNTRLFTP